VCLEIILRDPAQTILLLHGERRMHTSFVRRSGLRGGVTHRSAGGRVVVCSAASNGTRVNGQTTFHKLIEENEVLLVPGMLRLQGHDLDTSLRRDQLKCAYL
jgi:hypothetical protein